MGKVVIFPFSSAFCAYGSSTMDVLHVYERSRRLPLLDADRRPLVRGLPQPFNARGGGAASSRRAATSPARALTLTQIAYTLELDMKFGGQLNVKRVASPIAAGVREEDMKAIYAAFETRVQRGLQPAGAQSRGRRGDRGVRAQGVAPAARTASVSRRRPGRRTLPRRGRGSAPRCSPSGEGPVQTPVYEMSRLAPGNAFAGPALIESDDTTVVVSPGWTLRGRRSRSGIVLTHSEEAAHV